MLPFAAAAAMSLAGAGITAASQGKMNKRAMRFQREMFDKTNAYNHPLAQRERLEAAGLNPNLVYGGSAGGAAGTASQPAQPDLKAVDYTSTGNALGETASQYLSWQQVKQQTETSEATEENIRRDTLNKAIDSVSKTISAHSNMLSYKQKAELFNTVIAKEKESLRNLSVNTDYIGNKDAREHAMTQKTLQKVSEEINNLKAQGRVINEESKIKLMDRILQQETGLKPHDPAYFRLMQNIIQTLDPDFDQIGKRGLFRFNNPFKE